MWPFPRMKDDFGGKQGSGDLREETDEIQEIVALML